MVKEEMREGKKVYLCELCDFAYEDKGWAERCEAWCDRYKSCNLDIIQHAIKS